MSRTRALEGIVLCWVGAERLAIEARGIARIVEADASAPWGGAAFDPAPPRPAQARGLEVGDARVAVERIDVVTDPCPVFAVPPACGARAGLVGFVEARGELWPLVELEGLSRFVGAPA